MYGRRCRKRRRRRERKKGDVVSLQGTRVGFQVVFTIKNPTDKSVFNNRTCARGISGNYFMGKKVGY